jgi:hypothetical protein
LCGDGELTDRFGEVDGETAVVLVLLVVNGRSLVPLSEKRAGWWTSDTSGAVDEAAGSLAERSVRVEAPMGEEKRSS